MFRLILLLQLLFTSNIFALTQSFIIRKTSVQIKIPEDWKFHENLLEVPLTILGPSRDKFQPYIGIIDSGELDSMVFPSNLEKLMNTTAEEELKSLTKANYLDPKIIMVGKNEKKEDALLYQMKLEYGKNEYRYYETIYYLYCNKSYLSIYTRYRSDHMEYEDTIFEIVDGIKCL